MFTEYNTELRKKVLQALIEGSSERELVVNRVILAEMRAQRHGQIPLEVVR